MTPYKKRAKAGWSAGKEYKKQSNRSERNYAKQEVRTEVTNYRKPIRRDTQRVAYRKPSRAAHRASQKRYAERFNQMDPLWYEGL